MQGDLNGDERCEGGWGASGGLLLIGLMRLWGWLGMYAAMGLARL